MYPSGKMTRQKEFELAQAEWMKYKQKHTDDKEVQPAQMDRYVYLINGLSS